MLSRIDSEQREYEILSPFAAKAADSAGRLNAEALCDFRTAFQRDRDRIIHSKAFRRLMHKTQVFIAPEEDHFRTRLTHTLEVSQIARSIARALRLNEDLTEAIALGHDLGHTPFGHSGESALARKHPGGFHHNIQSLRVVDTLESSSERKGMNLTMEVRDGIRNHTGDTLPKTLEGCIVRTADRMAYINHDIDDAMRAGIISETDLPRGPIELLGRSTSKRIDSLIRDMIVFSDGHNEIRQSPPYQDAMAKLRSFLFDHVYFSKRVKDGAAQEDIDRTIFFLYDYFLSHPDELPQEYQHICEQDGLAEGVKDHIAGMTDRYAREMIARTYSGSGSGPGSER
ncbi:MAG: deoxyguanosinetriphosphate triphosphohydrolase [Clostridiales Family XIII bacterium]|jgi:dGTPase|nr:deoxyguanosinetriphosphate triphosphohydrolase [Clostridiales Family XIII bacterium]